MKIAWTMGWLVAFTLMTLQGLTSVSDSPFVGTPFTERLSVNSDEVSGNFESDRGNASTDGRYVVFSSTANNLVVGDTNSRRDIFLRDRQAGTTTRISIGYNGSQANQRSFSPVISGDGHLIAFASDASKLGCVDIWKKCIK